jgi:hypothetical protein
MRYELTVPRTWQLDLDRFLDVSWWHWLATVAVLGLYVTNWRPEPLIACIALCGLTAVGYEMRLGGWHPWPVQIRMGFLALLVIGTLPGMWWVYYSQLAGVTTMLAVGYCPMHRMLQLMPWNRRDPLTWSYVTTTFLTAPGAGGLFRYSPGITTTARPVCSG